LNSLEQKKGKGHFCKKKECLAPFFFLPT